MSDDANLLSVGFGLAAAAAAGAVGFATDRLMRDRQTAIDLGTDTAALVVRPSEERIVVADDGVPLHVEIDLPDDGADATRPTVVLVHGYTHSLELWTYQRRALREAGYRVVLFDLRGHGRSGEGEDSSYTLERLGRDLCAVVADTVDDDHRAVLVGHSMGGMTLMAFARACPEVMAKKVIGAGFVSTSSGELDTIDLGLGKQLGSIVHRLGPGAMARLGDRQGMVDGARKAGRDVERFLVDRYSFASPVPMSVVTWTAEMIFRTRMHVMSAYLTDLTKHDGREALTAFRGVETLVLHGAQDRITPREHGDAIVSILPGSEYIVVEHAGHVLPLEYPDLVDRELVGLAERSLRAQAGDAPTTRRRTNVRKPAPKRARRPRARRPATGSTK